MAISHVKGMICSMNFAICVDNKNDIDYNSTISKLLFCNMNIWLSLYIVNMCQEKEKYLLDLMRKTLKTRVIHIVC